MTYGLLVDALTQYASKFFLKRNHLYMNYTKVFLWEEQLNMRVTLIKRNISAI